MTHKLSKVLALFALAPLVMATALFGPPALAKHHRAASVAVHHASPAARPAVHAPSAPPVEAHVIPASQPNLLPDMSLGSPNAPVTVIEYASAACPHCAAWNAGVWPAFEAKYVTTGKVRYIFREILTDPQQYALTAFLVGRCAVARSKDPTNSAPYFAVVDSFFNGQQSYYQNQVISAVTADVTKKTGMTTADINTCVADTATFNAFMNNMNAHARQDGVSGTPTFFVNGQRTQGHEMADLDAAIAAAK